MFAAVIMAVVSSAYVYTFDFGIVCIMSLMYKRKNVVDSVLPCGMPCVIVCVVDCAFCVCVDWRLFLKYDLKNCTVSVVNGPAVGLLWALSPAQGLLASLGLVSCWFPCLFGG